MSSAMIFPPLACFGLSAIFSRLLFQLWAPVCVRWGLVDEPGPRKLHARAVPLAGGLAIFSALLLTILFVFLATRVGWLRAPEWRQLVDSWSGVRGEWLSLLGGGVLALLLGVWDDRCELVAAPKFIGQLLVAAAVVAGGLRGPFVCGHPMLDGAVTAVWVIGVMNAVNFMDNMNGLCAGLGAVGGLQLGCDALQRGDGVEMALSFSLAGAALGFLPVNYPRARAFLGDAGSHGIGCLLAVLGLVLPERLARSEAGVWLPAPLLILAVPILDLLWVVLLRWKSGRPFYLGDTQHLSHRLVRRGLSPAAAVAVIWILAAAIGALAWRFRAR